MTLPKHLAIIMDGNGRWASARRHQRFYGHIRGAVVAKNIIEESARLGISHLTLFTFSTENWLRPAKEVSFLMLLLSKRLKKEQATLMKHGIRFRCIGDLKRLPKNVLAVVDQTMELTAENTGMQLVFALSYGGRQDLTFAMRSLAEDVQAGLLKPSDIDEATIASRLETDQLPDPDLIVRTSGESRLSNFFLWQAAYSEIYITETLWPDFSTQDLHQALKTFAARERRFGRTSEQILESSWPHLQRG